MIYEYADGLEHITLSGGMVRLDWFNYTGEETTSEEGGAPGGEGSPKNEEPSKNEAPPKGEAREVVRQLVLPPAGFLRAYGAMQRFVAQLESQGVISRAPQGAREGQKERLPKEERLPKAGGSPNFE